MEASMKRVATIVSMALVFALALAIPTATFSAAPAAAPAGKTHMMKVEVVSVDMAGKSITVKDDKGESHTAPLLGKALGEAKTLKAGDKVTVTCQDDAKGAHQGCIAIKKTA